MKPSGISRRDILRGFGVAGAFTILSGADAFTQEKVNKLNVRGGAIDVHHHHQPPALGVGAGGRVGRGPWTPEKTLEQMDKFGISVAILSMTQMGDVLYSGNGRMKDRVPSGAEKYLPNGLYAELRKWYFDIAHAAFPWPMAALRAFMPESQILFGTDYSPEPIESTANEIPGLKLPPEFMQKMGRGNAERLFPQFRV